MLGDASGADPSDLDDPIAAIERLGRESGDE